MNTENEELTIEQKIETWKQKHKTIFAYEVEGKTVYLKQPDRKTLSAATIGSKGDPIKYNEIVLKNCWLGDNIEMLEDDSIFYGLSQKIDEITNAKIGELKKL